MWKEHQGGFSAVLNEIQCKLLERLCSVSLVAAVDGSSYPHTPL
jgi:hypothetical protein